MTDHIQMAVDGYKNQEWLNYQYTVLKKSTRDIAKDLGVHQTTIASAMRRLGIKRRDNSEAGKLYIQKNPESIELRKSWRGEKCWNRNGGQCVSCGYNRIKIPDHPRANNHGYVKVADLVAEKAIGRFLKQNEVVHHINGNKLDDRNCNLLVCTISYHCSLSNKIRWRKQGNWQRNLNIEEVK